MVTTILDGRSTLLTPRLAARIVSRIAHGIPIETVAQQLGIGPQTIWNWQTEGSTPEGRPLARRLRVAISHARAHREWHTLQAIDRIADYGEKDSDKIKALTWRLERHPAYRDRYGLKVDIEHSGTVDHRLKQLEQAPTSDLIELAPASFKALLSPDEDQDDTPGCPEGLPPSA